MVSLELAQFAVRSASSAARWLASCTRSMARQQLSHRQTI
jgi:hypothetical protein